MGDALSMTSNRMAGVCTLKARLCGLLLQGAMERPEVVTSEEFKVVDLMRAREV
jgi:hypothetical protein